MNEPTRGPATSQTSAQQWVHSSLETRRDPARLWDLHAGKTKRAVLWSVRPLLTLTPELKVCFPSRSGPRPEGCPAQLPGPPSSAFRKRARHACHWWHWPTSFTPRSAIIMPLENDARKTCRENPNEDGGICSPSKFQLHIHLTRASSEVLGTQPGVGMVPLPREHLGIFWRNEEERRVDGDEPGSCGSLSGVLRWHCRPHPCAHLQLVGSLPDHQQHPTSSTCLPLPLLYLGLRAARRCQPSDVPRVTFNQLGSWFLFWASSMDLGQGWDRPHPSPRDLPQREPR